MLHRAGVNPSVPLPSPGLFQGLVLPPPGMTGMDWDVRSHSTPLMAFCSRCSHDHNWDGSKISNAAAAVDRS